MATQNYFIKAEDGWVKVAEDCDFLRIVSVPKSGGFYFFHSASAPPVNSTQATGTITLSSTGPVDTDTFVVNDITYTFVTSASLATDVEIGGDNDETAANIASVVTANDTLNVAAVAVGPVVTVSAVEPGTDGNAITLTENATNVAVSGSGTLAGAVDLAIGNLVNCGELFVDVPIPDNIYARVDTTLPDRPLRLDVFTIPSA